MTLLILPSSQAGMCSSGAAGRFHSQMFGQGLVFSIALHEDMLSLGQCRLNPDVLISLQKEACKKFILVESGLTFPTVPSDSGNKVVFPQDSGEPEPSPAGTWNGGAVGELEASIQLLAVHPLQGSSHPTAFWGLGTSF